MDESFNGDHRVLGRLYGFHLTKQQYIYAIAGDGGAWEVGLSALQERLSPPESPRRAFPRP